MVDNKGVSPVPSFNFKAGDASGMANRMSEEKMGQGGEYFAQEMEQEQENEQKFFQDRSAQLRASLDSLAMANAGSLMLMKTLKEKEKRINSKNDIKKNKKEEIEIEEIILEEE